MIERKDILIGELLEFIIICILPLFTGFMFAYTFNFLFTPLPSYFYLNSNVSEIGIIPNNDNKDYILGNYRKRIFMEEAPFTSNGSIFLPVKFVAIANGIDKKYITYENGILSIDNGTKKIVLDCNKKTISINGNILTAHGILLVKNNEIFLSTDYLEKLFDIKMEIKGEKIILRNNLFLNFFN
ncbi:stalk domain-containing protein [Thermoanaerobacterium sp. CMT5567-10]|uniref:stalk domain-containing protein n=1 Tax=Thermoanaerobacterium sp. CMT5567-10 TaxID=3061989 RepID=UPI0026E0744F|nr:stalk domain-containing protein [Thermoanaerobacterium sp. CMT5567-10]WKV09457.1 stalk domain-containing protein [Thermoanaerobacterium sp. CMT5567-10]